MALKPRPDCDDSAPLFGPEAGACLSPRLAWLQKYDLETAKIEKDLWLCWQRQIEEGKIGEMEDQGEWNAVSGESEEDAIFRWALCAGVRLWNEERDWA